MYKVVYNDLIVDVLNEIRYVRYIEQFDRVVNTDPTSAHGFYGSDGKTVYILEGNSCPQGKPWKVISLQPISETEYEKLENLLLNNAVVNSNNVLLNDAKEKKISELSKECNNAIVNGVSVLFEDGLYHNFRLTVEDQLNLTFLDNLIKEGKEKILYHETNKQIQYFSADDIKQLIKAAQAHIQYHTTYFNILKHCIHNMYNIEEIRNIQYGVNVNELDISDEMKNLFKENSCG